MKFLKAFKKCLNTVLMHNYSVHLRPEIVVMLQELKFRMNSTRSEYDIAKQRDTLFDEFMRAILYNLPVASLILASQALTTRRQECAPAHADAVLPENAIHDGAENRDCSEDQNYVDTSNSLLQSVYQAGRRGFHQRQHEDSEGGKSSASGASEEDGDGNSTRKNKSNDEDARGKKGDDDENDENEDSDDEGKKKKDSTDDSDDDDDDDDDKNGGVLMPVIEIIRGIARLIPQGAN